MDFEFYSQKYKGTLTQPDFERLLPKAEACMKWYKRTYTVRGDEERENSALSAFCDILAAREREEEMAGVNSVSVGSVSTSYAAVDRRTVDKRTGGKLYRTLCLYMEVYRGIK